MPIVKKFLILLVIIIFSFIIYRLLQRRLYLIKLRESDTATPNNQEGFWRNKPKTGSWNKWGDDPDKDNVKSEIKKITISDQSKLVINNISKENQNIPLKQFCIKGSYNSAYSGGYVSGEMVKYVLSRGCRFLDFELYYLPKSINSDQYNLYVGYGTDALNLNPSINNKKIPLFSDVLRTTLTAAFTQQVNDEYYTQNTGDPLFIQIRLKCADKNKVLAYTNLRNTFDSLFKPPGFSEYLYKNQMQYKVDTARSIGTFMKKVLFVFEPDSKINILTNYVNLLLNGTDLSKQLYSSVNPSKFTTSRPKIISTTTTDVTKFIETVPDPNVTDQSNLNFYSSIYNYGYQINMMQYYKLDSRLQNYEDMFNSYKSSYVPMATLLNHIEKNAPAPDLK